MLPTVPPIDAPKELLIIAAASEFGLGARGMDSLLCILTISGSLTSTTPFLNVSSSFSFRASVLSFFILSIMVMLPRSLMLVLGDFRFFFLSLLSLLFFFFSSLYLLLVHSNFNLALSFIAL